MIQQLDIQAFQHLAQVFRKTDILVGRIGVAVGMVMGEEDVMGAAIQDDFAEGAYIDLRGGNIAFADNIAAQQLAAAV